MAGQVAQRTDRNSLLHPAEVPPHQLHQRLNRPRLHGLLGQLGLVHRVRAEHVGCVVGDEDVLVPQEPLTIAQPTPDQLHEAVEEAEGWELSI